MKEIRLTEEELKMMQSLASSRAGKRLTDYMDRVKREWFDPETLTVESLPVIQEAWKIIGAVLVEPLKYAHTPKDGTKAKNEYA